MSPLRIAVQARGATTLADVRERVARWERLGVDGVVVTDHLFVSGGREDRAALARPPEPFTLLAAFAATSERLRLATLVSNAGLQHPALLVRQAAQLAALAGGDRVLLGLGAGWNVEEFEALGLARPSHAERMDRLEEAVRLARELLDAGIASLDGRHVRADRLPLAPRPATSPGILLGGGSDRLLELAGRYADAVDLNGSSRRRALGAAAPVRDDAERRLSTEDSDLEAAAARVAAAARAAARPVPELSVFVDAVRFGDADSLAAALCAERGVPARPLAECPYVLLGEPERLAETLAARVRRLGLTTVIVGESPELERLLLEVVPRARAILEDA